jgi:aminodeoxyfutalosine synthase
MSQVSQMAVLQNETVSADLKKIAEKVSRSERITDEDCLLLFEKASLGFVGSLANSVRERFHVINFLQPQFSY